MGVPETSLTYIILTVKFFADLFFVLLILLILPLSIRSLCVFTSYKSMVFEDFVFLVLLILILILFDFWLVLRRKLAPKSTRTRPQLNFDRVLGWGESTQVDERPGGGAPCNQLIPSSI